MSDVLDFVPVIVGGDIGVYSLARAFHERYGVTSVALSQSVPGPIADSRITRPVRVDDIASAESVLRELSNIAAVEHAENPGRCLLLFGGGDSQVRLLTEYREELAHLGYLLPGPSLEVLDRVTDKAQFAALAGGLGIATPRTVEVEITAGDPRDRESPAVDLGWPVIAKAARSDEYENLRFAGKSKVYTVANPSELDELWGRLRKAGFVGKFLVQEFIPGDDTAMRSVTAYVDSHGEVTMLSSARVLLGERTPTALGNTAAAIVEDLGPVVDQAAKLLLAADYRGFANFDIKIDPRDGRAVFFEVNPRIGRPNYYVTAAGLNPAEFVVRDLVFGERVPPARGGREVLFSIVPLRLLLGYIG
ncbi:MAG: hypothetical protein FWD83_03125, partial [Promicromonosporaceae bacterium]|nr:hypothetical protein [Promicromonosporaceae bacterium]